MINSQIKKILIFVFSLLLCFLSYKLCYFLAEKYFFDKFFYQKSSLYGYWYNPHPQTQLSLSEFGDRGKDINSLENNQKDSLFSNDNYFKIAIYGDSYVWGQGIKNDQRFAKILENKLNKIRPTRVYSLAESGDNIFNHYQKYQLSSQIFGHINLHIFALYYNDLLLNNPIDDRYQTSQFLQSQSFFGCTGPEIIDDFTGLQVADSLDQNNQNYCLYKKIVPLFPKTNALYINLSPLTDNNSWPNQQNFAKIISQDFKIFSPYSQDILNANHPNEYNVSKLEAHPSVLANQYYAQVLYQEITTNPEWGFIKK